MGVYLQGVPTDATSEQLQDLISEQYGRVANVQIIGVKGHVTKCAFVNFAEEASAQKVGGGVWVGWWGLLLPDCLV